MKDLNVEYYAYKRYVNYLFCLKGENMFKSFDYSYYDKDNRFMGAITISFNLLKESHLNMRLDENGSTFHIKNEAFKSIEYSPLCSLLCNLNCTLVYLNNSFILEYISSLVELLLINWDDTV